MKKKLAAAMAALFVIAVMTGTAVAVSLSGTVSGSSAGLTPGGIQTGSGRLVGRVLSGTAPTALLKTATSLGSFSPATQLKVTLPLVLPNQSALTSFVNDEYDRSSPDYRHFLKPAQFAAEFGAPAKEISVVEAALGKLGLTSATVAANHLSISVTASVTTLANVFKTPIEKFQASQPLGFMRIKQFFANTKNITLPASLVGSVTGVIGLSSADAPQPNLAVGSMSKAQRTRVNADAAAALTRGVAAAASRTGDVKPASSTPVGIDGGATPCPQAIVGAGYTAPSLAAGYDFNGLYSKGYHGEGMSAALVEFDDFHDSNVASTESCYDLSTPVSRRLVDGGVGGPPAAGEGEDMADISVILEMLPQLSHLYVYEAPADGGLGTPTDEGDGEIDLYDAFVTDDIAPVLSSSWGNCEEFNSAAYSALMGDITEEAAAQGQQIFDAAGDSGAVDCRGYPLPISGSLSAESEAALPWVTGVGGTDLSQESAVPDSGIHREVPWNDGGAGGGGQSTIWSMPSWQQTYLAATKDTPNGLGGNCNSNVVVSGVQYCRMVPDIALDADDLAGVGGASTGGDFITDGDAGSVGYSIYCATSNCGLVDVLTGEPIPTVGEVGGWEPVGGTSLATPLAASAAVLWDQEAKAEGLKGGLGFLNPDFYQLAANATKYAKDFFDVTQGSNSDQYGGCVAPACNPKELYAAGTGYDMASGLGSPEVTNLGTDLIANAATLDITPSTEAMYGYTSDPANAAKAGPTTTAPVAITGGAADSSYTATSSAAWLKVTSSGSTSPGNLVWYVDPAGLKAGTYTGTISVTDASATAAGAAPAVLTVTYTVTAPAKLSVSPTTMAFSEPAVTDAGAPTSATCGSTYWGDELLDDVNSSSNDGGTTTYAAPASSKASLTIANKGASGSQLHYLVDYVSDAGAWLSTDLEDGLSGTTTGATTTTPNQTTVSQPLVPTDGTVASGATASVPFASTANGNALGGYVKMNQGTYGGEFQIVDLADPAATVTVPASLVLGTGAGTPTMQWQLNGAGAADTPIQVTAAPGAATSFNLVLSDQSGVCGYAYSLGVANIDGSIDPDSSPTVSWMTVSSPYLQAGKVGSAAATAVPSSSTDTGSGNGYTPIDITAPSAPGVYQGYIVVDSQNAQGLPTYGPANQAGGPPNYETGDTGTSPLGAPIAPSTGDPMYIPVCVTVAAGAGTATSTGATKACPISTGTKAAGSGSSGTGTTTVVKTVTKTVTKTACTKLKKLSYVQHPAFPVVETKAVIYVNGKKVKTMRSKQLVTVFLNRPKGTKFTIRYVAYLDDGEIVSHQQTYTGCKVSKQITKVLHRPDRRVKAPRK